MNAAAMAARGTTESGGHVARLLAIRALLAECEGQYPSDDEKIGEAHDLVSGLAAAMRNATSTPEVDTGSLGGDLRAVRDHLAQVHARAVARFEAGHGPAGSVDVAARLLTEVESYAPASPALPKGGAS